MKTKKIKATNSFHNRETYIIAKGDSRWYISRRQYQNMWQRLCGVSGCKCSIDLVDSDGNQYTADTCPHYMANTDRYELIIDN